MNTIVSEYYPTFRLYQRLREQLIGMLTDADLAFSLAGDNPTLGFLFREIGETEHSYIDSFRHFRQDFGYRNGDEELLGSVARLRDWYREMDQELEQVIAALSQEEVDQGLIEREPNFKVSPQIQLEIYKEALIIFYGKCSVYLKAMRKSLPEQWRHWIA